MEINPISEPNRPHSKLRATANHRLRRGIYILPSFFTVLNLLCGYFAILATLRGSVADIDNAAKAIGLAILFDALDGRVARATGTNTEFGKQFDSLADVISFGIAPAFLAFAWGVRGMLVSDMSQARHIYQFGWLVTFSFVICCAWRLARFNIQGMAASASRSEGPGHGSRYFVGLPTPAAAGMIAAVVHAVKFPVTDWRFSLLWMFMVVSLSALMASTIRYAGFKDIQLHKRQPSLMIIVIGLLVASIVKYSEQVLLLMAGAYVLSGLVMELVRAVRHRMAPREEAHALPGDEPHGPA
jgi:CDP-diacylglycerol--serine O-phosphatidyltransferase